MGLPTRFALPEPDRTLRRRGLRSLRSECPIMSQKCPKMSQKIEFLLEAGGSAMKPTIRYLDYFKFAPARAQAPAPARAQISSSCAKARCAHAKRLLRKGLASTQISARA